MTAEQFALFRETGWRSGKNREDRLCAEDQRECQRPRPASQVFAKALFTKEYPEASLASDGIVLIFDSEDGGMVAAALRPCSGASTASGEGL